MFILSMDETVRHTIVSLIKFYLAWSDGAAFGILFADFAATLGRRLPRHWILRKWTAWTRCDLLVKWRELHNTPDFIGIDAYVSEKWAFPLYPENIPLRLLPSIPSCGSRQFPLSGITHLLTLKNGIIPDQQVLYDMGRRYRCEQDYWLKIKEIFSSMGKMPDNPFGRHEEIPQVPNIG